MHDSGRSTQSESARRMVDESAGRRGGESVPSLPERGMEATSPASDGGNCMGWKTMGGWVCVRG